jgi:hypothetical protein
MDSKRMATTFIGDDLMLIFKSSHINDNYTQGRLLVPG